MLVFAIPALQFIHVQTIGVLFASDLLLIVAGIVLLMRRARALQQRQIATLILLGLAWLMAQIITDLIRGTPRGDYLRGWSKILLTITYLATIWMLLRNSLRRYLLYGLGLCLGVVLACLFNPGVYFQQEPWKFGYAVPVTFGSVVLATYFFWEKYKRSVVLVLLVLAALNVYLNLRSLGLICLLVGVYCYVVGVHDRRHLQLNRRDYVVVVIAILLGGWGFGRLYEYSAESGLLGDEAHAKFVSQQGEGGLLLGGRSEILSSGQAILDSPLYGHGSWAKDPKYAALMEQRREELGYKRQRLESSDLIPTHSHIFGAWVEAGIVGMFFWLYVLSIILRALLRVTGDEPLLPIFLLIAFSQIWDILFSPYGAERRFNETYYIVSTIWLLWFGTRLRSMAATPASPE